MKKWRGDIVFILIVAAAIGGWVNLYPRQETSLLSPLDPLVDLQAEPRTYASPMGERLAYRLIEPSGEAESVLVLLHDTLLHSGWYAELGYGLANKGIAVYLPDRRGWGYSSGERCQIPPDHAAFTTDIIAMLVAAQSRYPQKPIFVGAHGHGAGLAMSFITSRRPVAGVVLIAPYITSDQPNLNSEGWRSFIVAHPVEAFLAQSGLPNWEVWRVRWPQSMIDVDPLLETRISIACMQETIPDDVAAAYRALSVPLLIVQGDADTLFDLDQASEFMAAFTAADRHFEAIPDADYLGVLTRAANPIAEWMSSQ